MVAVLEMVMDCGSPGYLDNELNVPEAVTETITTQWPRVHVPAVGLVPLVQGAEATVPPLSHPHEVVGVGLEVEGVTVRALVLWPLFWKSLSAAA